MNGLSQQELRKLAEEEHLKMVSLMTLSERRAWFVYEAARIENTAAGRSINPEVWGERSEGFRANMTRAVAKQCGPDALTSPEELHDAWTEAYLKLGWVYGKARDPVLKTHPDMVPFDDLPRDEQEKDAVFYLLCKIAALMQER